MSELLLIDGHSILNRAFYGIPDLTNTKGLHTNAVYGFLNILFKVMDEEKPDNMIVAFDVKEKTFRHKLFAEYKGTRKPMPAELHEQVPIIKDVLKSMNVCVVEKPGYEADDVLGTLAFLGEEKGYDVSILSGDRDLLQLATKKIKIRIPKTKKGTTEIEDYYWDDVITKYQVNPREFIDLKALMGDTADNIKGVQGIGEKTATKIITQFGSIENAFLHIDEVTPKKASELLKNDYEMAKLSKVLATIDTNAPLEVKIEDGIINNLYNDESYKLLKELEFKSLLSKFDQNISKERVEIDFFKNVRNIESKDDYARMLEYIQNKDEFGIDILSFEEQTDTQMTFDFLNNNISGSNGEITIFVISDDEITYLYDSSKLNGYELFSDVAKLLENKNISVFDLKSILKKMYISRSNQIVDMSIAAYLLNPLKDSYEYSDIARDFLSIMLPSKEEINKKQTLKEMYKNNPEDVYNIMIYNASVANKARNIILKQLDDSNMKDLYFDIELPLIYSLFKMEQTGVMVNRSALKEYSDKLKIDIDRLEQEIYDDSNEKFNINSPKQLGDILFEKMGIPGGKKTKTGYSTSAEVLEGLKDEYPFVEKILLYRQLTKLKSTYADGLQNYIDHDNRIHGTFNQTITATGRISSTEPNLQNIPIRMPIGSEIRKVFIPKDGCVFVDADYSQIELRILAHMSKDESLIEAYNSGKDIHQITASKVFGVPIDEVTKTQRSNAKAVNFGIVYGISSFGLSKDLSISRKEASEYIEQYFETYKGVKEFLDNTVKNAKSNGYITTMFGRRRPIPELSSNNYMQRSFGERIAMNSPIQGTAADIMKIAMINVDKRFEKENLKSRIVIQVHDELLVEAYIEEKDIVSKILLEEMSNAANLKVNLEIGIASGNNWLEAH